LGILPPGFRGDICERVELFTVIPPGETPQLYGRQDARRYSGPPRPEVVEAPKENALFLRKIVFASVGPMQLGRRLTRAGLLMLSLVSFCSSASGQELYKVTFKGTTSSIDSTGNEFQKQITTKSLIQEWASKVGVSNYNDLELAFHRNVDSRGDAIEVVNKHDGSLVVAVFPLFFPESATASTPKSAAEKRFAYVYNLFQSEVSRGSAIMNERMTIKNGQTNHFIVDAAMQWYQLPEGTNRLRISTAKFKAGKKLVFH
jgi:hypothetical protein